MQLATQRLLTTKDWQRVSDVGRAVLIGAAIGAPLLRREPRRALRNSVAVLIASGAAKLLKRVVPEERPDGSDRRSFPSDHAAETFAAAATLDGEFGAAAGAVGLAAATFVAGARVGANRHHPRDVAVGAVLGVVAAAIAASAAESLRRRAAER